MATTTIRRRPRATRPTSEQIAVAFARAREKAGKKPARVLVYPGGKCVYRASRWLCEVMAGAFNEAEAANPKGVRAVVKNECGVRAKQSAPLAFDQPLYTNCYRNPKTGQVEIWGKGRGPDTREMAQYSADLVNGFARHNGFRVFLVPTTVTIDPAAVEAAELAAKGGAT
jgi:hypothetical protein